MADVTLVTATNAAQYRTLYERAPFDVGMVAQPRQHWGAAPPLSSFDTYASGVVTISRSEPPTVEGVTEPTLVIDESPVEIAVWTAPGPAMFAAMFCRVVDPQTVKISALATVAGRYGQALDQFGAWLAGTGRLSARMVVRNPAVQAEFAGRAVTVSGPNVVWQVP